jgi:hypothetical protein
MPGDSPPQFEPIARLSDLRQLEVRLEQVLTRLLSVRNIAELPSSPSDASLKKSTALYIVEGNLPLSHPRHPAFREFLTKLLPDPRFPVVPQIRREILALAEGFQNQVTPATEGFHFVHLMADIARVRGRNWLGVCLVTLNHFMPWGVIEICNQTSKAIAEALGTVIENLGCRGLSTCSVVTDNAQNEISAVKILSSKYSVLRVPCLSHTANLVIHDFFSKLYPGHNVFRDLGYMIDVLLRPGPGGPFHGCPTLTPTRWFSLWEFFTYVVDRYDVIRDFLAHAVPARDRVHPVEIFERYDFRHIVHFLELIGSFIKWSECEDSTLGTTWGLIRHVNDSLVTGIEHGMPHANVFMICFASRFTETADIREMLLAYLMTRNGLEWYRALGDETIGLCRLTQGLVNDLTQPIRRWFVGLIGYKWKIFEETWAWYLQNATFEDQGNVSFWTKFRGMMVKTTREAKPVLCEALGTLGLIFAIMPVSESGVERVFSHLRDLLLPHRDQMKAELIQARLLIKLNHYPDERTCDERLCHLDRVDREGPEPFQLPALGFPLPELSSVPGFASQQLVVQDVDPASQPSPHDVPRFHPHATLDFHSLCDQR